MTSYYIISVFPCFMAGTPLHDGNVAGEWLILTFTSAVLGKSNKWCHCWSLSNNICSHGCSWSQQQRHWTRTYIEPKPCQSHMLFYLFVLTWLSRVLINLPWSLLIRVLWACEKTTLWCFKIWFQLNIVIQNKCFHLPHHATAICPFAFKSVIANTG